MTDHSRIGRNSRRKGQQFERDMVNWHKERGIPARRNAHSGAREEDQGDLVLGPALAVTAECKLRKTGFTAIYDALEQDGCDVAFLRQDRRETVVAMPLSTWEWIARQMGWTA